MSYKSILVVASGQNSDAEVIGAAAKLATRFSAQVSVAPAFPDPAADLVYYGATLQASDEARARIADSERGAQERLEVLSRDIAARERAAVTVEKRALQPIVALAPAAILADVVMFAGDAARASLAGLFAETLLSTRAPVMLIKGDAVVGGAAAVAWDGSAQAARAIRAAMPLLQAASRVLLMRNIDDETKETEASDVGRLRAHLARHGVGVIEVRDLRGARVADSLLDAARAEQCELLVAGAYGRPRLFEMVLGGTTRALVNAAGVPNLLLSH